MLRAGVFLFVTLAFALGHASMASSQDEADATDLYLEAYINGVETGLIGRFLISPGGKVRANADELRNIGLDPGGLTADIEGDIPVERLRGVDFRIDHAKQSIHFEAPPSARATKVIDAAAPKNYPPCDGDCETAPISGGFGALLNYSLYAEGGATERGRRWRDHASGLFNSRLFTPHGALNHDFSFSETERYRRRETYWRTPVSEHAVQFQVGDMITRGPGWAQPVRLGGVQVERNFDLRPDIITTPLPSYSGTAAVPTTVDVYDGSIRRYSAEVPAGPFELVNLPFSTGANQATVILRDATGREVVQDLAFLVSPDLLRKGTADYSLSLGYPRIGVGTRDDGYQDELYGAASLRFGVSDGATLSAHAEAGDGLAMAGLGGTFRVGALGAVGVSYARSHSGLGDGDLFDLSARIDRGRLSASGRILRADESFVDIARRTTMAASASAAYPWDYSAITRLDQFTLNYSMSGVWSGVQAVYANTRRLNGGHDRSFGLTSSFRLGETGSLNLSALATRGDTSEMLLGATLHFSLGGGRSAGASAQLRDGSPRYAASLSQNRVHAENGWEWRLDVARDEAAQDARTSGRAFAGRRFSQGRVDMAARVDDKDVSLGLRAEGAVVLAGGGAFLSNRINDSFAIVDTGLPGVDVELENRPVGATGSSGKILLPDLRPYERNAISIETDALPIEAEIPTTREIVVPAYHSGVTVEFDIDPAPANAIIHLVSPSGEPTPVGLMAVLNETEEPYVVGHDGALYLRGLSARNSVRVLRADGWGCAAEFGYRDQPGTVTDLGKVVCR